MGAEPARLKCPNGHEVSVPAGQPTPLGCIAHVLGIRCNLPLTLVGRGTLAPVRSGR